MGSAKYSSLDALSSVHRREFCVWSSEAPELQAWTSVMWAVVKIKVPFWVP